MEPDAVIDILNQTSRKAFEAGFRIALEGRVTIEEDLFQIWWQQAFEEWEAKKLVRALTEPLGEVGNGEE